MRAYLLASIMVVVACHKATTGGGGDDDQAGPDGGGSNSLGTPAFMVQSSDLQIGSGEEITECYYFHTPNTTALPITAWESHMTPGSHHMIMFWGSESQPADGTVNQDCGVGEGSIASGIPVWVYASQMPDETLQIPTDDGTGTGTPLAQPVPPNQPAVFQMHYLNESDDVLTVHVQIEAYALPPTTKYTETDAYITYNANISIPPEAVGVVATDTCTTPTGAKFWTMSTHSHKQSVETDVKDNSGNMIFQSTDWQHPGATDWNPPSFYEFPNNSLTVDCTYNNNDPSDPNSTTTIHDGPSAQTNEMCMATGYFFPATGAQFCYCPAGGCYEGSL
jgi:hypothetical protein